MAGETDNHVYAFPVTQWSLVERARNADTQGGHEALAFLLKRYLPALRTHLAVEKRLSADRTEDLLQGFVADKIIEQNLLKHASQVRGKFRSFLLVTLNNYITSKYRSETAAKRVSGQGFAELNENVAQMDGGHDPAEQFNAAWARELIAETLKRMEAECENSQRQDLWTIFRGRVLGPVFEGREALDYQQLVKELGLSTPLEACQLLTTAKRMFARNLREVTAEYAGPDGDVEVEIQDLRATLSKAGEQLGDRPLQ